MTIVIWRAGVALEAVGPIFHDLCRRRRGSSGRGSLQHLEDGPVDGNVEGEDGQMAKMWLHGLIWSQSRRSGPAS